MKKKITIVGNGFASLFFIQYFLAIPVFLPLIGALWRRLFSRYDITLIGTGRFIYFPSIPEFITGKRNTQSITVDIRPYLKCRHIRFVEGQVTDIRDEGRSVVANGSTYQNDALFVGIGPAFLEDDIPGTREHTFSPCRGPKDMEAFMTKLNDMERGIIYLGFKINRQDGFVAGRAGQMYESACLLDYALKKRGVREKFELHFFSSNLSPGDTGGITDRMKERGIILDYGYEPAAFTADGLRDPDGTVRKADLVLYSPGITGSKLVHESCLSVTAGGHIDVDKFGQVRGVSRVFAAGDCASHENPPPWVPHQAHMAQLRSQAAARNLRTVLKNERPIRTYRHELSCILNMENDAMWMHRADDNRPPFRNLFPRRSIKLIRVKNWFEKFYFFYLRYL